MGELSASVGGTFWDVNVDSEDGEKKPYLPASVMELVRSVCKDAKSKQQVGQKDLTVISDFKRAAEPGVPAQELEFVVRSVIKGTLYRGDITRTDCERRHHLSISVDTQPGRESTYIHTYVDPAEWEEWELWFAFLAGVLDIDPRHIPRPIQVYIGHGVEWSDVVPVVQLWFDTPKRVFPLR
jgi:hypothetical protein